MEKQLQGKTPCLGSVNDLPVGVRAGSSSQASLRLNDTHQCLRHIDIQ
jgi:hypothetical protein